jgi:hypothetical protein
MSSTSCERWKGAGRHGEATARGSRSPCQSTEHGIRYAARRRRGIAARAERLADALRKDLEPELAKDGGSFNVTLPSDQIARGAEIMAGLEVNIRTESGTFTESSLCYPISLASPFIPCSP